MKKMFFLVSDFFIMVIFLAGCGEPTTESVVNRMLRSSAESCTMNAIFSVMGEAKIDSVEYEAGTDGNVLIQANWAALNNNEAEFSIKGEVTVNADGQQYEQPIDLYTHTTIDERMINEFAEAYRDILLQATLLEKTREVAGEDCYVLVLETNGESFYDIFLLITEQLENRRTGIILCDEEVAAYLQCVEAELTLYVSVENGWCIGGNVNLANTDLMGIVEVSGIDTSMFLDGELDNINLQEFFLEFEFNNWNETDVETKTEENSYYET